MIKYKKIDFEKVNKVFPDIDKVFARYGSKIVVAYVFGSYRRGEIRPLSDIDLAVLLDRNLSKTERLEIQIELLDDLIEFLGTEEIDLVILNDVPLSIQYGVLKDKKIVYYSDKQKLVDFEADVVLKYLDIKPLRDEFNREFIKRAGEYLG
ncbi:type VII toxin-antitoxin system MntA family adenylyltransferase antitoxin [Carboxydothermus hydrogenoformans]|uniref:Nucleotidyltransferase domain protein n=1 Tax=Carboxydothermus hydrogenoformans (strain ATCC BAA-161 / DSM 6008 / Z-2901) TaxID=246194 RepID=Q3AFZ3_CARHZ|nr:nucleotidyltransferase domain-containing protein [Carboxydothermus hydrogenoformans]ABB15046.1 nucleotidyltransferase domain protein [Carboxydothermus hydrogenoformans Z-2901]